MWHIYAKDDMTRAVFSTPEPPNIQGSNCLPSNDMGWMCLAIEQDVGG